MFQIYINDKLKINKSNNHKFINFMNIIEFTILFDYSLKHFYKAIIKKSFLTFIKS